MSAKLDMIYGPVKSRRMGISLGINLGSPDRKICTWGCVYCQCGFGERRSVRAEDSIPTPDEVLASLESALSGMASIDCVTFAGNTEPTGHPSFPEIVARVLELRRKSGSAWIVNCLSNGSELDQPRVVEACDQLDEIWVKLDCATEHEFQRLSRPVASVGSVEAHIARIRRLKNPRIQTLLWESLENEALGNWNPSNRLALEKAYLDIRPIAVHVTTVERITALNGLVPVPELELKRYAAALVALGIPAKAFP